MSSDNETETYFYLSDTIRKKPPRNAFLNTRLEKIFDEKEVTLKKYLCYSNSMANLFKPEIDYDRNKLLDFLWKNRLLGRNGKVEGVSSTNDILEWKELQKQKELKFFIDQYLTKKQYKYLLFKMPGTDYSLAQILNHLGFVGAWVSDSPEGEILLFSSRGIDFNGFIDLDKTKKKGIVDTDKIKKMLKQYVSNTSRGICD